MVGGQPQAGAPSIDIAARRSNFRKAAGISLWDSRQEELIAVGGGKFTMGGSEYDNERPIHSVWVDDFRISKFLITVHDFEEFIKDTAYVTDAEKEGWSYVYRNGGWEKGRGVTWRYNVCGRKRKAAEDTHPVIHVSWEDAAAFCEWADGRLPTEAEWEYAARGGSLTRGYQYSGSDNPAEVGWYRANSHSRTHPVGQKKANELGIYDMSGNVWEWCSDYFSPTYYQHSPSHNPSGPTEGIARVLRGGTWHYDPDALRVSNRDFDIPNSRGANTGFRICRNVALANL